MNVQNVSKEFASDLIGLINSLKGIEKDGKVDYTLKNGQKKKFEYITLDKIYAIVKNNSNFAIMEPLGTDENGNSAVQVILVHKSGECLTSDYYKMRIPENCTKQDEGSAITYTKRYAVGSFLGICTDEDNDANPEGKIDEPDNKKRSSEKPKPAKTATVAKNAQVENADTARLVKLAAQFGLDEAGLEILVGSKYKIALAEVSTSQVGEIIEKIKTDPEKIIAWVDKKRGLMP